MKYVYGLLASLVLLIAIVFGLQLAASERVEVVELHTIDEEGAAQTTRLWIVDDAGYQYLRVGADGSGWFSRLQANGSFEMTRNGDTHRYVAELRHEKSDHINDLMQAKYTWGDSLIGVLAGSRDNSVPVELHPVD